MDIEAKSSPHPPLEDGQIDFSVPPVNIEKYQPGRSITRENVTSFIVWSFVQSRGDLFNQRKILDKVQQEQPNLNRDLKGFVRALSKEEDITLTQEETDCLVQSFQIIRMHRSDNRELPDDKIIHKIQFQLAVVISYHSYEEMKEEFNRRITQI